MAGNTHELNRTLEPENMAKEIVERFTAYNNQRQLKINEWKELRNYIFATDTTTTTNKSLPWKNSTTIPKICQIRDNLHANYMAALFPNDDWLRWESYTEDEAEVKKASNIEAYMKNKCRQSRFQETVSRLLYDYIDYGNAIADCEFVSDFTLDETGGKQVTYVGPKAIRISPYDIVFNPLARDFASSPKYTRYMKNVGELVLEAKSRPEMGYNMDIIDGIEGFRNGLSGYDKTDWDKAEGLTVDGFGSLYEYYQSGMVEIIEVEGSVYDNSTHTMLENYIITVIDRRTVVRMVPNPSWMGGSHKVHAGWRLRPDNLYAMGPLDNLVGMQYRIDHLENLKADVFDMIAHPPLKIRGDVEDFTWGPYAEINLGEDGDVEMMHLDATALNADMQIERLMNIMEEMAGAPKQAMGIRTPGEKTAFEVQSLENAAGRIFQQKITYFEENVLEPLLNNMLEQARRLLDITDVIKVMDTDLGVEDFIKITKDDLTSKGKLRPVGARHFAARAQLLQNLTGVFNSPIGEKIAPHVSSKKLSKFVEDILGIERFSLIMDNIAVTEQAETQRLVNANQEAIDTESITPAESPQPEGQ
jgi:hypothetical protein